MLLEKYNKYILTKSDNDFDILIDDLKPLIFHCAKEFKDIDRENYISDCYLEVFKDIKKHNVSDKYEISATLATYFKNKFLWLK
jgi:hypothetical protein